MRYTSKVRLLPLALGIALLGCGDDGPTNLARNDTGCALAGTSNISVSGGMIITLNSCTLYTVATDNEGGGADALLISFQSSTAEEPSHTMLISRDGVRPAVGSYAFGEADGQFNGLLSKNTEPERLFGISTGTINITTSNANTLAGSINATGTEVTGSGTPASITVSGSFTARCIDTPVSNC